MSLPERLLDVAGAAHEARRAGHTEIQIAHAAGVETRNPHATIDEVTAVLVNKSRLTHPEDIQSVRETVTEILALAGLTDCRATESRTEAALSGPAN